MFASDELGGTGLEIVAGRGDVWPSFAEEERGKAAFILWLPSDSILLTDAPSLCGIPVAIAPADLLIGVPSVSGDGGDCPIGGGASGDDADEVSSGVPIGELAGDHTPIFPDVCCFGVAGAGAVSSVASEKFPVLMRKWISRDPNGEPELIRFVCISQGSSCGSSNLSDPF